MQVPFWQPIFTGRKKYCERSFAVSPGQPILDHRPDGRCFAYGQCVLMALYNDGRHLYIDMANSWPQRYHLTAVNWKWLQYRKHKNGMVHPYSRCVLYHGGHNSRCTVSAVLITARWLRSVDIQPHQILHLIDFGSGVEGCFTSSRSVVIPSQIRLG